MNNIYKNEFEKYLELRKKAVSGLIEFTYKQFPPMAIESWLEKEGFSNVNSEYFSMEGEEHEYHEYYKDDWKVVIIQVFMEQEGGLYHQTYWSNKNVTEP